MAKKTKGFSSELSGGKKLAEDFKKIGKEVMKKEEQALLRAALIVERDAKLNAPVDTGRLRISISSRVMKKVLQKPYAEVGTNVEYAKSVEFGTSKQSAQPFLFPAYNNNKDKILKELAKAFQKGAGL